MPDGDFGKPIIAIVNSFTQFVPGHVHLKDLGQMVAREVEAAGGVAKEFNTIAVDDGIAMGHDGMLYSLPSREVIADSVEYMVNAHCADAMVCISNCDKITPGMLMAASGAGVAILPEVYVRRQGEAGHETVLRPLVAAQASRDIALLQLGGGEEMAGTDLIAGALRQGAEALGIAADSAGEET